MKTGVFQFAQMCLFVSMFSITACNKGDYYQKDYLGSPTENPESTGTVDNGGQGGVDSGVDGSTQGGVDGGVTGGTTAGATTGSSAGGTDGSTSGGTDGSTVGGTDGGTTGSSTGGSTPVSETFHQAERKKLDIVWIIDNSGSMADEQQALGYNFDAFINEFIDTQVDFKMAITTTDTSSDSLKGKMVYGSDTKLTSAKAQSNPTQFKTDFMNLVKVGTSGSGYEKGLGASEGFMQKYASTFVRSDAYLAVVLLSDEEDQSSKTPAEYMNYLKSFKSDAGLVKFYSICDVNNTNSGYGITTGCNRYKSASQLTAGTVQDIRNDFYQSLADMGNSLISLLDSFPLSADAIPGSIVVTVNGANETEFTYDATSRSIKFNVNHVPPMGAEIVVSYSK